MKCAANHIKVHRISKLDAVCLSSQQASLTPSTSSAPTSMTSLQNKHLARVKASDRQNHIRVSPAGSKSSLAQRSDVDFMTEENKNRLRHQLSSPFSRQDIFYSGSVTNLQEYKASPNMVTYVKVIVSYSAKVVVVVVNVSN